MVEDVCIDPPTGTEIKLRAGGGRYPDYQLGESAGESRYESGCGINYYEADPNLRFVLEGHLDAGTFARAEERLDDLWRAILKQRGPEPVLRRVEQLVSGVKTDPGGRFADLFGDVVALAALTREADRAAATGDRRKALVGELFATQMTSPQTPPPALTDDYRGVPELYEPLVAEDGCPEEDYRGYLRFLGRG